MKYLLYVLAIWLGTFLFAAQAQGVVITVNPIDDATASDSGPQDGVFDFLFTSGDQEGSVNNNGFTSFRSAFEFDISGVSGGSTINSATLSLRGGIVEGPRQLQLHGYIGNGIVQLGDFALDGLVDATTVNPIGGQTVVFDVQSFVADLIANSDAIAGFNLREEPANTLNFIIMFFTMTGQDGPAPELSINFTPPLDHFLSYEVKEMKDTPKFEKRNVILTDQFETATFEVKKLKALYNPVDKNGEGIIDPVTHLVGYEIKLAKTDPPQPEHVKQTNIQVDNQFGMLRVDTVKPDRLLVPSAKSLAGPTAVLESETVDHFKCYQVEVTEGTPEFVGLQVTLEDQFTAPRVFEVDAPTRLCNPVDKNGEGILDSESHLMCYAVRRVDITNIHVNNQFGPLQVETKKERKELCVPSTKQIIP